MNKLFGIIAGFAVTIAAVATVAVVSGVNESALAASCTNGTKYTDFDGSRSGNTLTVWPKKKLCKDVKVNFTTFEVLNKNYNGKPFKNNPTALPQSSIWNKTVTLKKGSASKVSVAMKTPDACTPYQIDAYIGPVQTKVTTSAGLKGTTAIVGKIFNKTKTNCNPPVVDKYIKVCRLSDKKYPVTIKEKDFDVTKYSKNPDDCKTVELVVACNLKTMTIEQNVDKSKIDEINYTLDLTKCEKVEKVKACNLDTMKIENDVDSSKIDGVHYTTDLSKCAPKCEIPGKEDLPKDSPDCVEEEEETPVELPHTGPAEAFTALLGLGALTGTGAAYYRSRR